MKADLTPHSSEAEQALLGLMLHLGAEAWIEARDHVRPKDFYNPIHEIIAKAMWSRFDMGLKVDPILLNKRFTRNASFKEAGIDPAEYLALLLDSAPRFNAAPEFAKMVSDLSQRRLLIKELQEAITKTADLETDAKAGDVLTEHTNVISAIEAEYASAADFVTLREAGKTVIDKIGQKGAVGFCTGIPELTEAIAGLQRGKLYIGAGRPGMFKSGFAANLGRAVADREIEDGVKGKVGVFSLEMDAEDNAQRDLSYRLGLDRPIAYQEIQKHNISAQEKERLKEINDNQPEILIDGTPGIGITLLEKRARAMRKQMGGLDLLIIDYLQLMGDRDIRQKGDTRAMALTAITSRLKSLSKALGCAVLALAQVNRGVDSRDNKRPLLADLRDSGSIEQDADVVMMLYREEYYMRKQPKPTGANELIEWEVELASCAGKMEVIIAKNRSGPEKTIEVKVDLATDTMMPLHEVQEPNHDFDFEDIS